MCARLDDAMAPCTDEEESAFKGGEEDSYHFSARLLRQNELLETLKLRRVLG
jgi:hypothetical protein